MSKLCNDLRLCKVKDRIAYFHRWADVASPIGPSVAIGGFPGGQTWQVVAIVEYPDGSVHQCYPHEVVFCDEFNAGLCAMNKEVDNG